MRLLLLFNAVASMAIASNNIGDWDWDLKDLSANDLFSDDSALDYLSDDSFVSGLLDKTNIDAFGQLQNEPTINASGHLDEANSDASRTLLDEPTIHALGQVPDEPITDDASGRLPYESPSGAFGQFLENPTIDPPDPSLENPNIHLISDSTTTTKNEAEGSPIILKPSIEGNPKPETQIARTSTCDDYFGLACCTGEAVHSPGSSEPRPSDSLQDISGCSGYNSLGGEPCMGKVYCCFSFPAPTAYFNAVNVNGKQCYPMAPLDTGVPAIIASETYYGGSLN